MTTSKAGARGWRPFDGIRGVALVVVLALHAQLPYVQGGVVMIEVFFVLSGFLITSLLLRERADTGAVSLRNFYARRALRLFPALALAIAGSCVIVALGLAFGEGGPTITGLPFVIFYLADFARAFGPSRELGLLGVTWSLAIEEQFYMLWPVVFVWVARRRPNAQGVARAMVALAFVDELYRWALVDTGVPISRVTFAGDSRCDGLLVGCAVAFWIAGHKGRPLPAAQVRALHCATVVGICALLAIVATGHGGDAWMFKWGLPISVFSSAALVASIVAAPMRRLNWFFELEALCWLGRRSYGAYLFHYPIFVAVGANGGPASRIAAGGAMSIAAAAISYRYLEQPFLRRRSRFQGAGPLSSELFGRGHATTHGASLGSSS